MVEVVDVVARWVVLEAVADEVAAALVVGMAEATVEATAHRMAAHVVEEGKLISKSHEASDANTL